MTIMLGKLKLFMENLKKKPKNVMHTFLLSDKILIIYGKLIPMKFIQMKIFIKLNKC